MLAWIFDNENKKSSNISLYLYSNKYCIFK